MLRGILIQKRVGLPEDIPSHHNLDIHSPNEVETKMSSGVFNMNTNKQFNLFTGHESVTLSDCR